MPINKLTILTLINGGLLIVLWQLDIGVSRQVLYLGLLMLTISFGLSHGALDWYLAKNCKLIDSPRSTLTFITSYVSSALTFVMLWYWFPVLAWFCFLMISIWHFSSDWDCAQSLWLRVTFASCIVCGPALWHPMETTDLFQLFLPKQHAPYFIHTMSSIAKVSLILTLLGLILKRSTELIIEWLMLLLVCIYLPPLVYFGFYFCQLHAYKHWQRHFFNHQQQLTKLFIPVILTSLCILGGVIFISYQPLTTNSIQVIFIELAALTIPHVVLIHIIAPFQQRKYSIS